jgi:hypothetical protein
LLRGGGSGDLKAVVFDEPLGFGNVLRCAIPPFCGTNSLLPWKKAGRTYS